MTIHVLRTGTLKAWILFGFIFVLYTPSAQIPLLSQFSKYLKIGFLVFSGVIKWEHWPEIG